MDKLNKLYNEALHELKLIGIDILNLDTGIISISLSNRSKSRYGVCVQKDPDKNSKTRIKAFGRYYTKYQRYNTHEIKISTWVMNLDDQIIKNTIIHELIHCIPGCNDHGEKFKAYARIINEKLDYHISTRGNKEEDYKRSNLEYKKEEKKYNYKITCDKCGQTFYRQRLQRNFEYKYRCICGNRFRVEKL